MTIRLLRTLVAVADARTFSAAAGMVHVTHAAVSQQMRTLEADLGVTLFDRGTRTPELTPVARRIVARARKLIAAYDDLVPSALNDGEPGGVINLGAIGTTLTGLTPQAMTVLKSAHPGIGLHIRPGLTGPLLADVERGALDAAIVTKPHLMPPGLIFRELTHEPMQLIAAAGEPGSDPIELLRTRPFIRFNRNAVLGALIDTWILSRRIRVNEAMELDSPEAIISMVHENLGVSIVPDPAVKPRSELPVKRIGLGPGAPYRTIGLAYREEQVKPRAIEGLFAALKAVTVQAGKDRAEPPA